MAVFGKDTGVLLTRYCLRNPIPVTLFFVLISLLGLFALARMGRSTLPPVSLPVVTIAANYPGAGATEIERLVVEPIEDELNGLPDLSRLSASGQNGVAEIIVQFRFGSNVDVDRANVQQAVDAARVNLPTDLVPPVVSKDDPTQAPVLDEAISSALISDAELSDLLDHRLEPALRGTAGVGTVLVSGAQTRQFTIRPRDGSMDALHATALDVFRAAAQSNDVFPGGVLRSPIVEPVIGINAAATSSDELQNVPIPLANNSAVRIGDLADVQDGYADESTISRVDGDPSVIIYVSNASGFDALRTIANVRKTFRRLSSQYPVIRFEEIRTDAPATNAAISGVLQTLGEGVALTVLVMLLFLHAWRNAAIAAIAIPTSLCAAFAAMWMLGFTLNVLSLMGLSLTIGILVDDSIVIIEAIVRYAKTHLPDAAALAGRRELGEAALAITLVDVAVFAPIALMSGIIGEFMREFGLVIVFATAFSLLVSFTLTPLLTARWALAHRSGALDGLCFSEIVAALRARARTFPWTFRARPAVLAIAAWHATLNAFERCESSIAGRYARVWLPAAWKNRVPVLIIAGILCAAPLMLLIAGAIPAEFSPPVNRGVTTVDITMPPGTPLAVTDSAALKLTNALLDNPAIRHVESTAGRAFNGTSDVFAADVAQLAIVLADPTASGSGVTEQVKRLQHLVPAASIAGAGKGMGGAAPISYNIAGDQSVVDVAAGRIASVLRANPDATDVRTSALGLAPYEQIAIDPDKARLLNVSADDAAQTARIATGGAIASKARLPSGLVNVVVRADGANRGNLELVSRQMVRSSDGRLIPLGDIAQIRSSKQPVVLEREDGRRIVTVSANPVDGVPISVLTSALSRKLREPGFLPDGAAIEPRGDVEQFLDAVSRILGAFAISLLCVYMILAVLYGSYTSPLIIMLTVPLAGVGALGTLFILNVLKNVFPQASVLQFQTLNLYSMLGIVMLVGVVAKNGILLVEYAERGVRRGLPAYDAMLQAAQTRFRPILMTTLAMVAGMLPLALGHTIGAEYRRALGTVVIGGLSTSLLLTLFVVPVVYLAYYRRMKSARKGWIGVATG